MTTLLYKSLDFGADSQLVLVDIKEECGSGARFIFDGFGEGELRLGERCAALKRGEATFKFSEMESALFSPKLITDFKIYNLAPLELSGGKLKSFELLGQELIALRAEVERDRSELFEIAKRVSELEKRIGLANTFKL